jgi:hypothetical protein
MMTPTDYPRSEAMLTAEQILSRLNELRKDYQDEDDPENEHFQALHHAFLFLSYEMEAFKRYVQEAAARQSGKKP